MQQTETEREASSVCQFGPGRCAGRGAETLSCSRLLFTFHASKLLFTTTDPLRGEGGQLIQSEAGPAAPQVITILCFITEAAPAPHEYYIHEV